ncbi:calcium-activated chloride channel regulator 1-like isoform X2 [Stegodyphus dumicola]|uniref:calcium-activated chloride channel regulator 1-like isoform X2 n=1 Tax=Stegodyphus dumicola TaxID=202533 RepID=UPI0015AFFB53|nr:calcium-activated chloride channel regulator 1-like isoform X2 [Stegodyphus dumicola]
MRLCIILVLLKSSVTNGKVTAKDGAYNDILIRFSPRVKAESGISLVKEIQKVLTDASEVLNTSIGLKISNVVFLLPRIWDVSNWTVGKATPQHTHLPPDIFVENLPNSAYGNYPFTLQYGGCSVPGRYIFIQENFLTAKEEFPKGKLFAREWLKFRYGVFDEHGFEADKMYPLYYKVAGEPDIQITNCIHPPAEYYFKKGNEDCILSVDEQTGLPDMLPSECRILIEEKSANLVTSSLMYFHTNLTQVSKICGDENHPYNSRAPNKQNTLCNGRSSNEIVQLSSDFQLTEQSTEEITFAYVQEEDPTVIIVWQNTGNLYEKKEAITGSVLRLLNDLPKRSKAGLYWFTNTVHIERYLNDSSPWPSTISSNFISEETPCITCALNDVVNALTTDMNDRRGFIAMIAGANPSNYEEVLKNINSSDLCLIVIGFRGATRDGFKDLISASNCGSFYEAPIEEDNLKSFSRLYNAMATILPPNDLNYETIITDTQYLEYGKLLKIRRHDNAASFTLRLSRPVELQSLSCKVHDTTVLLKPETSSSFSFEAQADEVVCTLQSEKLEPVLTQIQMISDPNEYFENFVWIRDTTLSDSSIQMPVIIYAQIMCGGQPVQSAGVKAEVIRPSGHKSILDLLDDGLGDPDITANDGVYSRYFTDFDDKGEYKVTVTATDNNRHAKVGQNGVQPCCGSNVISDTGPLRAFQETVNLTFKSITVKPRAGYKPSKIFDLRIIRYDIPYFLALQWTAPGAEADRGNATKYILKSFYSRDDAINKFDSKNSTHFEMDLQPKSRGEIENTEIEIFEKLKENLTYFISMLSVNGKDLYSEPSNVVELFIRDSAKNATHPTSPPEVKREDVNRVLIAFGIVLFVIFSLACIYLAIHFFLVKPKQQK